MPPTLVVITDPGSESQDELVSAVQDAGGYILLSDCVYEITTWRPHDDAATRWVLRRVAVVGSA